MCLSDVAHYTFWSLKREYILSSYSWPDAGSPSLLLYLPPRALAATPAARPAAAPCRTRTAPREAASPASRAAEGPAGAEGAPGFRLPKSKRFAACRRPRPGCSQDGPVARKYPEKSWWVGGVSQPAEPSSFGLEMGGWNSWHRNTQRRISPFALSISIAYSSFLFAAAALTVIAALSHSLILQGL